MKALIFSVAAITAIASPLFAQSNSGSYQDQYGLLSERNMFNRDRPRPRVRDNSRPISRPDTTSPQAVERAIVLRGVAIEDNELHAYLENSRTGQRFRVAPGDTLASGRVAEIAIDAVAYEVDGRTAWIEIGQNLSGIRNAETPPVVSGSSAIPGTEPSTPSPSASSLEERMKQRRLQQRGAGK